MTLQPVTREADVLCSGRGLSLAYLLPLCYDAISPQGGPMG